MKDFLAVHFEQIYHNQYAPVIENQMNSVNKILCIYYIIFYIFHQRKIRINLYLYDVCTQGCNVYS